MRVIFFSVLFCISSSVFANSQLKFGDPAPAIHVEKWLHGQPIEKFQPGQVYIVEFWATWCGPCIAAMPHLAELHKKYESRGLHVLAFDGQEHEGVGADTVENMRLEMFASFPFSWGFASGKKMVEDWMTASDSQGIPNSFVVDREGHVVFIGHPLELDEILPQILDGTWQQGPMLAAQQARVEHQQARAEQTNRQQAVYRQLQPALNAKKWQEAASILEAALIKDPDHDDFMATYIQVLRELHRYEDLLAFVTRKSTEHAEYEWALTTLLAALYPHGADWSQLSEQQKAQRQQLGATMAQKILELNPIEEAEHAFFYYPGVAQYYFETGRVTHAIHLLQLAIDSVPDTENHRAHFYPKFAAAMADYTNDKVCLGDLCVLPPAQALPGTAMSVALGQPAPHLKVTEWIKGAPLNGYSPKQVTVIEFWATWCRPCRASMPKLSAWQEKYGDKIRVIAASGRESGKSDADKLNTLRAFVNEHDEQMNYAVAFVDPNVDKGWRGAVGSRGIPEAFIIDQNGALAFFGDPSSANFEKALERIVAGTWDIEEGRAQNQAEADEHEKGEKLVEAINLAIAEKRWDDALAAAEAGLALDPVYFGLQQQSIYLASGHPEQAMSAAEKFATTHWDQFNPLMLSLQVLFDPEVGAPAANNVFAQKLVARVEELLLKLPASEDKELVPALTAFGQGILAAYYEVSGNPLKAIELLRTARTSGMLNRHYLRRLASLESFSPCARILEGAKP